MSTKERVEMDLVIERFMTGPLETNTYLIAQGTDCLVIDPSSGLEAVLERIAQGGLRPAGICLTHGHFDHILGIETLQQQFPGLAVWVHPAERMLLTNSEYNCAYLMGQDYTYSGPVQELTEGRVVIGPFSPTVLHIPGHSPGGCAFVFDKHCFSGDALFAGSVGRSDFPGGDGAALIENIRTKLFVLPDETIVYPGHGNRTTIGREKRQNPYF
jgi:glyoxylase-like metal-dependent hydrolase (beta-lactamase superfamily II)